MVVTKFRHRRIDGDARQPGGEPRLSIKILDIEEGIQKTILDLVFRVLAISHDPLDDTKDFFDMSLAELSERGSSSTLGCCYQLRLAPRSKIANR